MYGHAGGSLSIGRRASRASSRPACHDAGVRTRPRLQALRSVLPFFAAGLGLTLFMAWGVPLLLASRGLGPSPSSAHIQRLSTRAEGSTLEVRRSVFSDWCIAEPSHPSETARARKWPDRELHDVHTPDSAPRSAPIGCVLAPAPGDQHRFARIDTGLAGWPFRAFASEAWFSLSADEMGLVVPDDDGEAYDPIPEYRNCIYIGEIGGRQTVVALRPLPIGLAADILFWASASWVAVALPNALRRRRREQFGKCGACGFALDPYATTRPTQCPECGVPLRRDPLGFARSPEMHFQNAYVWLVFVSSLDIMLTWKILDRGGIEVNPVAKIVIDAWGMHGAIAFKFALMLWVIVACELLARRKRSAGKFLAFLAVGISASPVAWSLCLLAWHGFVGT